MRVNIRNNETVDDSMVCKKDLPSNTVYERYDGKRYAYLGMNHDGSFMISVNISNGNVVRSDNFTSRVQVVGTWHIEGEVEVSDGDGVLVSRDALQKGSVYSVNGGTRVYVYVGNVKGSSYSINVANGNVIKMQGTNRVTLLGNMELNVELF